MVYALAQLGVLCFFWCKVLCAISVSGAHTLLAVAVIKVR